VNGASGKGDGKTQRKEAGVDRDRQQNRQRMRPHGTDTQKDTEVVRLPTSETGHRDKREYSKTQGKTQELPVSQETHNSSQCRILLTELIP
jgi:hypothetical protein